MAPHPVAASIEESFTDFLERHGPRLRHAFIARYGPEVGSEVMGDVAVYAWEHWPEVSGKINASGWLYRVGQSRSRRYFRRPLRLPRPRLDGETTIEPSLPGLLEKLPDKQRTAVLLTQAFDYTVREAAEVLGVAPSTVQQNVERGLRRLRSEMGVTADV
jgi:RNA polymerase sigma-70 factor (ECF subfamily)